MKNIVTSAAVLSGLLISAPVLAQGGPPAGETVFDDTYVTVGIGGSYSPSYDGSDDYTFSVLPVITGSINGIDIVPRGPGFAVDFIKDKEGAPVDLIFGPVATVSFDRSRDIKDPVVSLLGKLDTAVELGVTGGLKFNGLLNPFDSLTTTADVKWDVAGAHDGMVVVPSVTYFTPLSRAVAVSLSVSAEHIDDDYADYYYSISPAGSLASGLPVFNAKGGFKNIGAALFTGIDLDGDITNGGFGLFAIGSYSRMLEDAKRSPVTSIRGSADQWFGAVGVGYTF